MYQIYWNLNNSSLPILPPKYADPTKSTKFIGILPLKKLFLPHPKSFQLLPIEFLFSNFKTCPNHLPIRPLYRAWLPSVMEVYLLMLSTTDVSCVCVCPRAWDIAQFTAQLVLAPPCCWRSTCLLSGLLLLVFLSLQMFTVSLQWWPPVLHKVHSHLSLGSFNDGSPRRLIPQFLLLALQWDHEGTSARS